MLSLYLHNRLCKQVLAVLALLFTTLYTIDVFANRHSEHQLWFTRYLLRRQRESIYLADVNGFQQVAIDLTPKKAEQDYLYSLLNKFNIFMDKHNIVYFGAYGAMIGVVRHGGLVPWDDDVDILIQEKDLNRLKTAFETEPKETNHLKLYHHTNNMYKITHRAFTNLSHRTSKRWAWPYLDVFITTDEEEDIYEPFDEVTFRKSEVFPPVLVPFGPVSIYMPRCFFRITRRLYDLDLCCIGKWNHRFEVRAPTTRCVFCDAIRRHYPFANYSSLSDKVMKLTVTMNGQLLRDRRIAFHKC